MALLEDILTGIVVLLIVLVVITFLELKYLRKAMQKRRMRVATTSDLPDSAHNAILTSKAISRTLANSGAFTDGADAVIREAEAAYRSRDYRVVLELTDRAKGILQTEKARHASLGDLARLQRIGSSGSTDETTKELLQKEYPPNYLQAKFTIALAEERIQVARQDGRATNDADGLLRSARDRFDAEDYAAALRLGVQSRKSADGEVLASPAVEAPVAAPTEAGLRKTCRKCGAELRGADAFCRKCGTPVP